MSYEPINWKDRIVEKPRTYHVQNNPDGTITLIPAPGEVAQEGTPVNAANLNHMEQGLITHLADNVQQFEEVYSALDRNFYDDYETRMQLYYEGNLGGPYIDSMLGMTFDGFQDTNRVDAVNTDAEVKTTEKLVECAKSGNVDNSTNYATIENGATEDFTSVTGTIATSGEGNIIDGDDTTYRYAKCKYNHETMFFDVNFDSTKIVKEFAFDLKATCTLTTEPLIAYLYYKNESNSWVQVGTLNLGKGGSSSRNIFTHTFSSQTKINGIRVSLCIDALAGSDSYYIEAWVYHATAYGLKSAPLSKVESTIKEIPDTIINAKMFISVKKVGQTLIPKMSNDGVNFVNGTLLNARTDPIFSDYIEEEWEFDFANSNNQIKGLLEFQCDETVNYPQLKRWCMYW